MISKEKSQDAARCYNYALRLLTAREYGFEELARKLATKYDEDLAYETADKCRDCGYQSDERAAEMLARHAIGRLAGPKSAVFDCIKRGIDPDLLDEPFSEVDFEELAYSFLERKYGQDIEIDQKMKQRMLGALYRRGFSASTSIAALRQFLASLD